MRWIYFGVMVGVILMTMETVQAGSIKVVMDTSMGKIHVELNDKKAPITVKNFLSYVEEGFFDGTIFHRVMDGFMIQGGGFSEKMEKKSTKAAIKNEAGNGLKNLRGTLAMARTGRVDSATAQFFINVVDNDFLDQKDKTTRGFGYAVFGRVVEGLKVVDKIQKVPVTVRNGMQNVPKEPVIIKSITRAK